MYENDYEYLKRIEEYAQRRWKEPLICTYLWDRYDLNTQLINRKDKLCRMDVDYAYDEDFNLRIILDVNPDSPFLYQEFWCNAVAYDDTGDLETGHIVLYKNYTESNTFDIVGELPLASKIEFKQDFRLVAKFYTLDETDYSETVNITEDVNLSDVISVHVRDYTDADYYVSSTGDDTNPGTLDEPFATIQHASNIIDIGDTICCLDNITEANCTSFNVSCYIIAKESHTVVSEANKEYFVLNEGAEVYIQYIDFDDVYSYNNGAYVFNRGTAPVYIKSPDITSGGAK